MQEVSLIGETWIWIFSTSEEKIQKIQLDKRDAEKKEIMLLGKQGLLSRRKKIRERLSLGNFNFKREEDRLHTILTGRRMLRDAVKEVTPLLVQDISFLLKREKTLSLIRGENKEIAEVNVENLSNELDSLVLNASHPVEKVGITKEIIEDVIWVIYLNLAKSISFLIQRPLGQGELSLIEESVLSLAPLIGKERKETDNPLFSTPLKKEEFFRRKELLQRTLKFPILKTHV